MGGQLFFGKVGQRARKGKLEKEWGGGVLPPFPCHLLNGMQIEFLNNFICGGQVLPHFYFEVFEKVKRVNES